MKKTLAVILLLGAILPLYAHKSWTFHAQDMYEVLQLEENPNLTNWMKYISSDLIDGYDAVKAYTIKGEDVENGRYTPTQNGDIRSLFMLFTLMAMQY